MNSWRDQILNQFPPGVAGLTLVADPDGLLLEEKVIASIRERGFELIPFEDSVAFRYVYEFRFRARWDCGKKTDLSLVLRFAGSDLGALPYDLLQTGRQLSFSLKDIFPHLSYPVVTVLDRSDLDALYRAQNLHAPGVLGDNATKEFVLRHVFEIAPEFIKQPSDLLSVLLRRHYREQRIPEILDECFIHILRQQGGFEEWPFDTIVRDREAFFAFLQERWPIFLDRSAKQAGTDIPDDAHSYELAFSGPLDLPFEHHDIRIYIDSMFTEGLLHPVRHEQAASLAETWSAIGIRTDAHGDWLRRVEGLLENIEFAIPAEEARHGEWFHFARSWAELTALTVEANAALPETLVQRMLALQTEIDSALVAWLKKCYAGLINLPPVPPVMLHHTPHFLARHIGAAKENKSAFVVVDGLSLDQWIPMRKVLFRQRPEYLFRENAVFAWLPTVTSVSRQAAFAGKPPAYFPNSIDTTAKEPTLWSQFWASQGLNPQAVAYAKGLGDGSLHDLEELVTHPKTRVVGLVVDMVDKIMHGMELGARGMHNQVRQWAEGPFMADLIDLLLDNGFRICLTSDHGNVEAAGCGRPAEGAAADLRGERVRIYSDALLRTGIKERFPDALEWPPIGLPDDYLPLFAPGRSAFVHTGEKIVGHGGISLEELIVPLVQIEKRDA